MLTSGSASTHPVVRITTAATATPNEPRRSAKTWRKAASTLRLWLRARERTTPAATFTAMPTSPIASIQPPSTSPGSPSRIAASTKIQIASATRSTPLASAASTSARL